MFNVIDYVNNYIDLYIKLYFKYSNLCFYYTKVIKILENDKHYNIVKFDKIICIKYI